MRYRPVLWSILVCLLIPDPLTAAWTSVGDGIEYQAYSISGPNNLFVARMDRDNTNAIIDSSIGQGRLSGGTERVSSQADRYHDAINYWDQIWGQRNDVVVAINGSYYNTSTGVPTSGVIHSGWYAKRYDNLTWESGFVWQLDRDAYIGECVTHNANKQIITYVATSNTQQFQGINRDRSSDELIIYTPQYDSDTKTNSSGTEVLVEMTKPMLLMPTPNMVTGYVRKVRQNQGSTPIPFDHVVLSATGSSATTLLSNVSLGAEIGISQEIKSYTGGTCSIPGILDWTKSYGAVSGNWVYLEAGVIQYGIDSSGARHPRTAIAYNNDYVYFIVCDGRDLGTSIGMTIDELAEFCKNTLGATWGLNQDGGGSSTMVVNGVIKNNPSDGTERAVSNGMMMINVQPKSQSSMFAPANIVETNTANTAVHLGPGTNYESIISLPKDTQGEILDHPLKGVYAKGYYWWKCDFSGTVGWVAETLLDLVSGENPPTIIEHPSDQTVMHGGTASFAVQAGGSEPLSYQWQKNNVDLSEGGHYVGVTTNSLSVTSSDKSDEADYRCMVSNMYGSTPSNPAYLNVISPDFDGDLDVDQSDFGFLQVCLGTNKASQTNPGCVDADLTQDDNIDQSDFIIFQECSSGPNIIADPYCVQ
ncbi:MAG: phosphodiester glycosidase family protein [Planctomycetota bacterium]|nr:MAG: phosphodiester glycosidase family protein [Planctomycetota bacterium]